MYNKDPSNASSTSKNSDQIIENVLMAAVIEQRRKRRWGIFFKIVFLALVILLIWGLSPWNSSSLHRKELETKGQKQIAQISLYGEIGSTTDVDAYDTIEALDEAVDNKNTQAIILDIDSPGGSPVQASYIYNEVRRLQTLHKNIPIDAVCEDLCASAAYYVASASNNIYANPYSLVGSIGVLMDGFGFVETMKKVGVSRRLYTAGKYKGFLDPFSPVKPDEIALVQKMLESDHQLFIDDVKQGRGNRLKSNPDLFTGLVWNGAEAKEIGLIDGFGSLNDIARDKYHNDNVIDYTITSSPFEKLFNQFGATFWHHFKMELSAFGIK